MDPEVPAVWMERHLKNAKNYALDHPNEAPYTSFGGPLGPKLLLVILRR